MTGFFNLRGLVLVPLCAGAAFGQTKPLAGKEKWIYGDQTAWEWTGAGDDTVLSLKKQSDFKPKVRSPFNLAWFTGGEWDSFTLTAEVRLDLFNKGNNDVCIAFSKESDTKFYYAHLGEKSDAVHLQLHLVNDADRKAITKQGAETLPWKPETWHQVKVTRNAAEGSIKVWFDGKEVLSATDKTLGKGAIGLGSFDDLGSFRNVRIVGE
ncbi:DUF1080 domain-containing protein [Luteolibacter sp. SL250]|uniref:family 16 glycoside hydrolase n=1 Tax=Luteolibacter sp. SL250 TaxID=2995170 RepID=UPI002270095F|nr:family 16 glycoside hydrolase [Luteolibacter sp. SL250]WAC20825.1 DUF1080 domain-containing protein [Luteolibacter sp. SL250]